MEGARARGIYTAYVAVASSSARATTGSGVEKVGRNLKESREGSAQDIYGGKGGTLSVRAKGRIGMKGGKRGGGGEVSKGVLDLERRGKFGGDAP